MDKNTKVLALKYRPTNFDELIGQEVVAETITNSIRANKIPNAYLFTGIRGVGKTTIARIVAKALNCKNGIEGIDDQKSCENCICESIANSNHIDVLELNGADKTSINEFLQNCTIMDNGLIPRVIEGKIKFCNLRKTPFP